MEFYWARKFTERLKNKRCYIPRNNSLSKIVEAEHQQKKIKMSVEAI